MSNPAVIGAVAGAVTWFVLDELLEDPIKKLFGKGKKGKGRAKGKKMIRNHYGQIELVDDYDSDINYEYADYDYEDYY